MVARWLAAVCGVCIAGAAPAQQNPPLDLRLVPVTEGNVAAIRQVHAAAPSRPAPPAGGPSSVGVPSDIEDAPPVGAVIYKPLGRNVPPSEKKWNVGAAATPDAQARAADSAYEVEVVMDDGERRVFRMRDAARFYLNQRVAVRSGELEPLPGEPPWSP